jgi:transcriptional regulator with PAS, ATPase and Fis domain
MQNIYEMIEGVAESDANILILGESGTGKEIIANAIHFKSHRAKKPFVKVNCSALPKELIESELFGHVKGAFTGATNDKIGFIGRANTGSLLLDEIGEMPIDLQPKLLRVLQEKVYNRVGHDHPQEVDFRLITATNRDPFEAIKDGALREDLYYRINTIEIRIPPLRERRDDIPLLAEHFLKVYADKYKRELAGFSQGAYDKMLNYSWRGNVRELEHVIERAILLTKGDKIESLGIQADSNPAATSFSASAGSGQGASDSGFTAAQLNEPLQYSAGPVINAENLFEEIGKIIVDKLPEPKENETNNDVFESIESGVVSAALKRTGGNKQAAANLLGLYRPRLYGMIKRHNL